MLGQPASRLIVCVWQKLKHCNFLRHYKYVKLCMMVVLIKLYNIHHFGTLIVFQGHSSVKQFQLKILCSHRIKLNICMIVDLI